MRKYRWLPILTACSLAIIPFAAQAQDDTTTTATTTVEKYVIVTPAPKAVCTSVDAHWEGNTWVDTHNVCKYTNRTEGVAWVDAYWSCTQSSDDGTCTTWALVPGHWVSTLP